MTCCVGTLCDEGHSIVLVSDKMIGLGMIESEPEINKVQRLHKNWRAMIAGDDIAPAFPIIEAARRKLSALKNAPTLNQVRDAVYESYVSERIRQAEASYLTPRGWTVSDFNSEKARILPDSLREEIGTNMSNQRVEVSLLVAGFDSQGHGHIFSVDDYEERGRPRSQDLPGYHAIGSGSPAAMYMMAYREVSSVMPLRLALYYSIEGKFFGERAGGVGSRTDVLILRANKPPFKMKEKAVEDKLFDLCVKLEPRPVRKTHIDVLNGLSGTAFSSIPKLKIFKEDGDWVIKPEGKSTVFRESGTRKSKDQP